PASQVCSSLQRPCEATLLMPNGFSVAARHDTSRQDDRFACRTVRVTVEADRKIVADRILVRPLDHSANTLHTDFLRDGRSRIRQAPANPRRSPAFSDKGSDVRRSRRLIAVEVLQSLETQDRVVS